MTNFNSLITLMMITEEEKHHQEDYSFTRKHFTPKKSHDRTR